MDKERLAKLFHITVGRGISEVRQAISSSKLRDLEAGEYTPLEIPSYLSQLAGAKNENIEGFYGNILDKRAALKFGTNDLDKFSYWAWRACGIVGMQMILRTLKGSSFRDTAMDLVNEGLDLGGYNIGADKGWYHKSLVALAEKHGLRATTRKFTPSTEIVHEILSNRFVLASIKSDTGGHLLLVYGFVIGSDHKLVGFRVHDPNDYFEPGKSKLLKKEDFDKLFTRRVIVVGK